MWVNRYTKEFDYALHSQFAMSDDKYKNRIFRRSISTYNEVHITGGGG